MKANEMVEMIKSTCRVTVPKVAVASWEKAGFKLLDAGDKPAASDEPEPKDAPAE